MAQKRMFSLTVVDTDMFLDMPLTTQALYFHLAMRADDDGFVDNSNKIMKFIGCSKDDMRVLIGKRFVIEFESGVIVIRHWKVNNYLRNDRHKDTLYIEEKKQLNTTDSGIYDIGIPNGNQLETQYRVDKSSIEKNSKDKSRPKPPIRHKHGEYKHVLLTDEQLTKLKAEFNDWQAWIEKVDTYCENHGKTYKNYLSVIKSWSRNDKQQTVKNSKAEKTLPKDDYFSLHNSWGDIKE